MYGQVTLGMISDAKYRLEGFLWSVEHLVDLIYAEVEKVGYLLEVAGQFLDRFAMIKFAYVLLQKHPSFQLVIKEFNQRPVVVRSWTQFKGTLQNNTT